MKIKSKQNELTKSRANEKVLKYKKQNSQKPGNFKILKYKVTAKFKAEIDDPFFEE